MDETREKERDYYRTRFTCRGTPCKRARHQLFVSEREKQKAVLEEILRAENLSFENVAAIGDDLNDLALLRSVALSFAPNDALPSVKQEVSVVLSRNGGHGAVREMIDYVVASENLSEAFVNPWL